MLYPRTLVFALLTALVAAGLSWHFFVQPLRPWPDQGWVLQAATRHARGEGLTNQMGGGGDLTAPQYPWLVYFPPLYPLLVSGLIQLGLPMETAVKGVNAVALVVGVWGWMSLALSHLRRFTVQLLFAGLLVVAGGALVPKGGTMDYLVWAGTPFWIQLLLAARRAPTPGRRWLAAGGAALLVALFIGVRWAAAILVPIGGLVLFLPAALEGGWLRRLLLAAGYCVPPTLAYYLIGAINRHYGGGANVLAYIQQSWDFSHLLTLYPYESLSTMPLGLEPMLKRLWRYCDPPMKSLWLGALFRIVLPFPLLAWFTLPASRGAETEQSPNTRTGELRLVVAIYCAVTIVFLAFMTAHYNWGNINWSYLDEPRYFRAIWPAAALFWLTLLDGFVRRGTWAMTLLLAAGIVYLLQAQIRGEHQQLTEADESWELVQKVRSLEQRAGLQVVVDYDISDYIVSAGPNLVANSYPDPPDDKRGKSGKPAELEVKISKPAELWIVRRVSEQHPWSLDPEFYNVRFEAMRTHFHAEKRWTSSQGNYELYYARVRP